MGKSTHLHKKLSGFREHVVPVELRSSLGLLCCLGRPSNTACPSRALYGFCMTALLHFLYLVIKGILDCPDKLQGSSRESLLIFGYYFNLFLTFIFIFLSNEIRVKLP